MRSVVWLRVSIGFVAVITAGLFVAFICAAVSGEHTIRLADFLAYYTGGTLIFHGHGSSLYSFPVIAHWEARMSFPLKMPGGVSPFIYPPWFALLMAPLALLPYGMAYVLWFAANGVFAVFSLTALVRYVGLRREGGILVTLLGLCFAPVFAAFAQGQVSLLLLASLVCLLWALRGRYDTLAGIALTLLLIKPQYALPVAGVMLLQRRWRVCGVFALCAALVTILPMPILGAGIEGAYVRGLIHLSRLHGSAGYMAPPSGNYSLQGFLSLIAPLHGGAAWLGLAGAAFLITVWAAFRDRGIEGAIALGILFGILASPHVLVYDVSLIILPTVLLAGRGRTWAPVGAAAYLAPLVGLLLGAPVVLTVVMAAVMMLAMGCSIWKERMVEPDAVRGTHAAIAAS